MKYLKKVISFNKLIFNKQSLLATFSAFLFLNYVFGCKYSVRLSENPIYSNSFYPLIISWILVVNVFKPQKNFLIKIALAIFAFSIFFLLFENRIVAEVLISYSLIIVSTIIIMDIIELKNDEKD